MAQNGRPELEIALDDHQNGKIYSTFDPVSGNVKITAPHNARFDEIRITLEGSSKTYVENLSPHSTRSRTTAVHNFLKLVMPVRDSDYPQPRIAEAGRTYTFPFNFAVPGQLLPRACSHNCFGDHVHEAHLQVPPSLGDTSVSIWDSLAPEMAKVQYCVRVKVVRTREEDGKDVILVEGKKKLRIVPAVAEQLPMNVAEADSEYILSKTQSLKKGMFSGKLGKIMVSAPQPSAIVLPTPASLSTTPPTTMANVTLRFDPHDASSQPPRLGGLTTKIKSTTFYAARPAQTFPSHINLTRQFETTRGVFDSVVPLSSRCVEAVTWAKHKPAPAYTRRNSASSSSSSDCSDDPATCDPKEGIPYYTADILVPITLSARKDWVPSFHSCIISRVYSINLSLTIHTPGTAVPASSVSLRLPVQIAAAGNHTSRPRLTAAEAAAELAGAEEYFRPRVIEVPQDELIGNSVLARPSDLPPSYEDFVGARLPIEPSRS